MAMKRVIVTNNKKVEYHYAGKEEVIMLKNATAQEVLQEGEKLVLNGGRLMLDPTRRKGYYKSLVLLVDENEKNPDEKSLAILQGCISEAERQRNSGDGKEPLLAGILQNRDLELVKSVLH
jgi:hypothetical protein